MFDRRNCVIPGCLALVLIVVLQQSSRAQSASQETTPVTAKIELGPIQSHAHPSMTGHAKTVGGAIDVSQPAPDQLVIRMSGSAAAMGSCLKQADAAMDFLGNLQFMVEFSSPGHVGTLSIEGRADGLLTASGKQATAGMFGAAATVFAASQEPLATLALPERLIGGCDSVALTVSEGPICVPIVAGCYGLQQQFRIGSSHASGFLGCGTATAEFTSASLPSTWRGSSYAFAEVDRSRLGYTVILTVRPGATGMASQDQQAGQVVTRPPLLRQPR